MELSFTSKRQFQVWKCSLAHFVATTFPIVHWLIWWHQWVACDELWNPRQVVVLSCCCWLHHHLHHQHWQYQLQCLSSLLCVHHHQKYETSHFNSQCFLNSFKHISSRLESYFTFLEYFNDIICMKMSRITNIKLDVEWVLVRIYITSLPWISN